MRLWNRYNVSDLTNVLMLAKKDRLLSGVLDANDVTNSLDLLKERPERGRFVSTVGGHIKAELRAHTLSLGSLSGVGNST